ncbi:MAG: signal peptide peptidase SppA [Sphingobacteriales bacterium]|nr:MAG: signal peptide peptidase SppA [Sphingobacteriales bacterium]
MRQFFKFFLASLTAIIVFSVIVFFVFIGFIGSLASSDKPSVRNNAVLYIDLSQPIKEQKVANPLSSFEPEDEFDLPGLFDVVRIIEHAKTDSAIKGIYLKCNNNSNGLATSDELRKALLSFKQSKKFIYAYGDVIPQRAYYVANVATKIYCNPKGGLDWKGFSIDYTFFKKALQKLEIEPQIFYAGKFKSATEPFREEQMTAANRLQTQVFLNEIYTHFLLTTAVARNTDTATLHQCANDNLIRTTADAVTYKLIDAAKYDDEVKDELKQKLGVDKYSKINFIQLAKYGEAVNYKKEKGSNKIAVVFAQGDIVDGKGDDDQIGGETFRNWFRKARLDKEVKAIVVRVNSGGGSALASETMWRELSLAREEKPVVISFGDYAASGGYYMSCMADSIFAQENTLTGSIGVFSVLPNMKNFFNNKLGITFDGVKTAQYADMMTIDRPLNDAEKRFLQNDVDSIYQTFLTRVSNGRKLNRVHVDSIAQGRVWTGAKGKELGLVDRIGGLQDAINCAARMAKLKDYRTKEFPEPESFLKQIFGNYTQNTRSNILQQELGSDGMEIYTSYKKIKQVVGASQARLPFEWRMNF